jgi:hypothetical protein
MFLATLLESNILVGVLAASYRLVDAEDDSYTFEEIL